MARAVKNIGETIVRENLFEKVFAFLEVSSVLRVMNRIYERANYNMLTTYPVKR